MVAAFRLWIANHLRDDYTKKHMHLRSIRLAVFGDACVFLLFFWVDGMFFKILPHGGEEFVGVYAVDHGGLLDGFCL